MKKSLLVLFFILMGGFCFNTAFCSELDVATNYYNEGIDLYGQNRIEESIDSFSKAIDINPNFYEAHYNLAQILISLNRNDEAVIHLEKINTLRPDDMENLLTLAKLEYKKGYLTKAYNHFKQINSSSSQYQEAKSYMTKIEKRRAELDLETKIKEHHPMIDETGKAKGLELEEINAPSGIATDERGNVYVASFSENQVYKISVFGKKTPFTKTSLIHGPIGVAVDKFDNIYVANYSSNTIVKISPDGTSSIFTDIKKPYCLIYDKEHHRLYVTEQETNKLVKFDL